MFFLFIFYLKLKCVMSNSGEHDQMAQNVPSALGLQSLSM